MSEKAAISNMSGLRELVSACVACGDRKSHNLNCFLDEWLCDACLQAEITARLVTSSVGVPSDQTTGGRCLWPTYS